MKPVAVLSHGSKIGAGYLGSELARAGVPVLSVPLYAGASLPELDEVGAIVSLGGFMGAYEEERYPYLVGEKDLLRRATHDAIPVLGICLGCQLLVDALGGKAYLSASAEVGVMEVELTDAGATDPVASQLDGPVLVMHQDTWDPPPEAELLARSDRYPQAFRHGSALGLQPHPEATPEMLGEWLAVGGDTWLMGHGYDPEAVGEAFGQHADAARRVAGNLFAAWVEDL